MAGIKELLWKNSSCVSGQLYPRAWRRLRRRRRAIHQHAGARGGTARRVVGGAPVPARHGGAERDAAATLAVLDDCDTLRLPEGVPVLGTHTQNTVYWVYARFTILHLDLFLKVQM